MADAALRRAPLAPEALPAPRGGPVLSLAAPMARFIFRGQSREATICGGTFGPALARDACRASDEGGRAALWLGPDEWLLLTHESEGGMAREAMESALKGLPHSLTDVSHRQTGIEIRGARAAALLNSHCMLDLDEAAFPTGMCTRTLFAKAEIVLWRRAADHFHIEVWRSFAPYMAGLLGEAALDIGDE